MIYLLEIQGQVRMQVSTYVIDFVHHFVDYCDQSREDDIKTAKLCFSAFVWNVWRERNQRAFESQSISVRIVSAFRVTVRGLVLLRDLSGSTRYLRFKASTHSTGTLLRVPLGLHPLLILAVLFVC